MTDEKLMHLASNALLGNTCAPLPCLPSYWGHEQKTCRGPVFFTAGASTKLQVRVFMTKTQATTYQESARAPSHMGRSLCPHQWQINMCTKVMNGSMHTASSGGVEFKLRPRTWLQLPNY